MRGIAQFCAKWHESSQRQRRARISPRGRYLLVAGLIIVVAILARPSPALRFGPSPQFEELRVGHRGLEHFVALRNSGLAPLLIRDLRLIGDAAGDFVSTPNDCTNAALPPGRSCIVGLTFTPHREGRRNAEVTVLSESGILRARLTLTGVASQTSDFRMDPSRIEFGDQAVGSLSEHQKAEITNVGSALLQISSPRIIDDTADDFELGNNSCAGPLPPSENCFVEVRFHPRVAGERIARVELHNANGGAPHEIALVGRGTVRDLFVDPELVQFPPTQKGQRSETASVIVRNSGTLDVQIGTPTLSGEAPGEFHIEKGSCESVILHPSATCEVRLQFLPMAIGLRAATVSVMDDSPDGPHTIHLQGSGSDQPRPCAQIYARTYSFDRQPINTTSKPLSVFVNSCGAVPLNIATVRFSGAPQHEFWLNTDCSRRTLRAKENCKIDVYFRPTAVRNFRAEVSVPHNASDAPNHFDVEGDGLGSEMSWCCAEGKLSKTDENSCKSLGGQIYPDLITAVRMCASGHSGTKAAQPETPSGLEPGASSSTNSPAITCELLTLHWNSATAPGGYLVWVSSGTATAGLRTTLYSERTSTNGFRIPHSLEAGSYEWSVTSLGTSGEKSAPAPLHYFRCNPRIVVPGITKLVSPTLLKGGSSSLPTIP